MKIKHKLLVLIISLLFISGGLVIKYSADSDLTRGKGLVAGDSTNLIKTLYPKIPLYPNARVTSVLEKADSIFLTLESADAVGTIKNYYKDELARVGWQTQSSSSGSNDFFMANKKLSLTLASNQNETSTVISLTYVFVPTK